MNCRIVHINKSPYDIYIGRGGKWGNQFKIGVDGDRTEVINKYRSWLLTQPELMACIGELKNKTLGCHCKPKACHGDILVELANASGEMDLL